MISFSFCRVSELKIITPLSIPVGCCHGRLVAPPECLLLPGHSNEAARRICDMQSFFFEELLCFTYLDRSFQSIQSLSFTKFNESQIRRSHDTLYSSCCMNSKPVPGSGIDQDARPITPVRDAVLDDAVINSPASPSRGNSRLHKLCFVLDHVHRALISLILSRAFFLLLHLIFLRRCQWQRNVNIHPNPLSLSHTHFVKLNASSSPSCNLSGCLLSVFAVSFRNPSNSNPLVILTLE